MAEARTEAVNQCLSCHEVHYPELGDCTDCHAGIPRTQRRNIAHHGLIEARYSAFTLAGSAVTKAGDELLDKYSCRRCHVSAGKGNSLAADLDLSPWGNRASELDLSIEEPVLYMPQFHFREQQRVELVNAILLGSRKVEDPAGEVPQVVHFELIEKDQQRQFEKHCGSCHRSLTELHGGLGSGLIAPNLSGLFTRFYPANSGPKQDQSWTQENLKKWLKNPREFRPDTQMAPLKLKEKELTGLIEEMGGNELVGEGH